MRESLLTEDEILCHRYQIFQVGCDTSFELMKICSSRGFQVMTSNCLQLPYRDSVFDAAVCIAVIHHLATEVSALSFYAITLFYENFNNENFSIPYLHTTICYFMYKRIFLVLPLAFL